MVLDTDHTCDMMKPPSNLINQRIALVFIVKEDNGEQ